MSRRGFREHRLQIKTQFLSQISGVIISVGSESLEARDIDDFIKQIRPAFSRRASVILDLSTLRFIDNSGLIALLFCLRAINRQKGQLKLVGLSRPLRALFELFRMNQLFCIYDSTEEAIASLLSGRLAAT